MLTVKTSELLKALYPEELIKRYDAGERSFTGINLLRKELEHILGSLVDSPLVDPEYVQPKNFNPMWADFCNPVERRFEWDSYGRFIPVEYDDILPDRDLRRQDLKTINLEGAYLYPVDFSNSNLSYSNLRHATLIDVNLSGANLSHADLRHATIFGNLESANLYMARLEHSVLAGCNLQKANLIRAKLRKTNLANVDLRGANLSKVHFEKTMLNGAKLQGVDFQDVVLDTVYLTGISITSSQQSHFLAALRIHLEQK